MTSGEMRFRVLVPQQSANLSVFSFAAKSRDVAKFARVEGAKRDGAGVLTGFQRGQIAGHINEIRDYLEKPGAILPNPLVVGFAGQVRLDLDDEVPDAAGRTGWLTIDVSAGAPGWIVDGQQRFTALSEIPGLEFEVLVSGFICKDMVELQKQFILINNTRPLPKALVYELLPHVDDLPERMSSRAQAALMVEALNFRPGSSLRGLIRQQTNPRGIIRDTVLQRVIMHSISDGALRLFSSDNRLLLDRGYVLMSEYFHAVKHVFSSEWEGHTPKTSRLVHGTGIAAMGFVMDRLHSTSGAEDREAFAKGLRPLVGQTAWTSGEWHLGSERRRWNGLQNVPADIHHLADHLVRHLKRAAPTSLVA